MFGCQTDRGPDAIVCYSPQQIQKAYGVDKLLNHGLSGSGRTIVIIDAFQNPTMATDLAAFDTTFGLPAPVLNIIAPDGLTPFDPTNGDMVGWAGEIALDVQWSHAIAPGAKIDLVLSKSDEDSDILSATKYAVDHNLGDVISQSFGENENCVDPTIIKGEHTVFANAVAKGITVFASSGDEGAAQPTCDGNSWTQVASSPAYDPLVTGVGGTELSLAAFDCAGGCRRRPAKPAGTYESESALNEAPGCGRKAASRPVADSATCTSGPISRMGFAGSPGAPGAFPTSPTTGPSDMASSRRAALAPASRRQPSLSSVGRAPAHRSGQA